MKFVYFFIILFFISCSSANKVKSGIYIDGIYKNSEVKYYTGELEEKWKLLDIESVDLGFYNTENNAIIYVNSKCKNSSDAPLYVLRTHLLIGFKEKKFQESKKIIYQKREALDSTLVASLDGVKRKIRYLVFKKDDRVCCPECRSENACRLMSACGFKSKGASGEIASQSASASSCSGCTAGSCAGCH